jgi:hypothetical protein
VAPSKVRPDWSYPPELEAVVLKLLSKKKEERFSNAIEVRDALDNCMEALRARQDVSLEMNPVEVAELLADPGGPVEGAATLRLSTDMIAKAMAAEGLIGPGSKGRTQRAAPAKEQPAAPATNGSQRAVPPAASAPAVPARPVSEPLPSASPANSETPPAARNGGTAPRPVLHTGPTSALRTPAERSRPVGLVVGLGVLLVVVVSVGAWFLFGR